jgi:F-type H+-transporting ATPase subunit gamma
MARFLGFNPDILPKLSGTAPVCLLLGSERGFCGDFNEALLARLETFANERRIESPLVIATGRKLAARLEADPRVVAWIDGASVVEEVGKTLHQITHALAGLQGNTACCRSACSYHDPDREQVIIAEVLPPSNTTGTPHRVLHTPADPPSTAGVPRRWSTIICFPWCTKSCMSR